MVEKNEHGKSVYEFKCGCISTPFVGKDKRLYCPKHGERLGAIFLKCMDCGKELKRKPIGGLVKIRCLECKKKHLKAYDAMRSKKRRESGGYRKNNESLTSKPLIKLSLVKKQIRIKAKKKDCKFGSKDRKYDCKHYPTCLSGILLKNQYACGACKKYAPKELDIKDYVKCRDTSCKQLAICGGRKGGMDE